MKNRLTTLEKFLDYHWDEYFHIRQIECINGYNFKGDYDKVRKTIKNIEEFDVFWADLRNGCWEVQIEHDCTR